MTGWEIWEAKLWLKNLERTKVDGDEDEDDDDDNNDRGSTYNSYHVI